MEISSATWMQVYRECEQDISRCTVALYGLDGQVIKQNGSGVLFGRGLRVLYSYLSYPKC
jgi:hypothetical protein